MRDVIAFYDSVHMFNFWVSMLEKWKTIGSKEKINFLERKVEESAARSVKYFRGCN